MSKALGVWQSFAGSLQEGSQTWQDLLANDIEFIGPVMQTKGKDEFIKMNQEFMQMIRGFDIHKQVASDATVANECTLTLATPKQTEIDIKVVELFDIQDGKIQSLRVYYDPREFVQEFAM